MPRSQGLVGSSPTSGTGNRIVTVSRIGRIATRTVALAVVLSSLWAADPAAAQRRDFVGRVVTIDAQNLQVKDRRGNALTFVRAENTVVEGRGDWQGIAPGDKVLVRWNLTTGIARQVVVLEGPAEATTR
jgi:hypothetical protein